MRNLVLLSVIIFVVIAGCSQPAKQPGESKPSNTGAPSKKAKPAMLSFGDPIVLDSSGYVMFPLSNNDESDGDGGSFSSGGRARSYWNIVFYDSALKKYHLLDENRKMIITHFDNETSASGSSATDVVSIDTDGEKDMIFYSVITTDFNENGKLEQDDPEYLFISDKHGNNFRQISPDSLNVVSWKVIKKTGKILMEVTTDSNNDKKFGDNDEISPYIYDIKSGGIAQPVFSDEFKSHVNALFKKQWPKE